VKLANGVRPYGLHTMTLLVAIVAGLLVSAPSASADSYACSGAVCLAVDNTAFGTNVRTNIVGNPGGCHTPFIDITSPAVSRRVAGSPDCSYPYVWNLALKQRYSSNTRICASWSGVSGRPCLPRYTILAPPG
jgi:hypothetical protein